MAYSTTPERKQPLFEKRSGKEGKGETCPSAPAFVQPSEMPAARFSTFSLTHKMPDPYTRIRKRPFLVPGRRLTGYPVKIDATATPGSGVSGTASRSMRCRCDQDTAREQGSKTHDSHHGTSWERKSRKPSVRLLYGLDADSQGK